MSNKTSCFLWLTLLIIMQMYSQVVRGVVIDSETKQPLESVSVFFDNTTIGTATDEFGKFIIRYHDAIQSDLVISYLGYEKIIINNFRDIPLVKVEMKPSVDELDEVLIISKDELSRKIKLILFRKEFLGRSVNADFCKIKNEKDIRLRYNEANNTLVAFSKQPIVIENKRLNYEISYDINDFEILFNKNTNPKENYYKTDMISFSGNMFFKDLNNDDNKKKKNKKIKNVLEIRKSVYTKSIQRFMRALYLEDYKSNGYVFNIPDQGGFSVDPHEYIIVKDLENTGIKEVSIKESPIQINFFQDSRSKSNMSFSQAMEVAFTENEIIFESILTLKTDKFYVDKYGNYTPVSNVLFSGVMGNNRIADMLPSDYQLREE